MFVVFLWALYGAKKLEPVLFPVVTDFKIHEVKGGDFGATQFIRGSFIKRRACRPLEVIAYHNDILLILDYSQKRPQITSRALGKQYYDWWQIIPPVSDITLYVRHSCDFGTVMTKMYEGKIVATPYEGDDERPLYE